VHVVSAGVDEKRRRIATRRPRRERRFVCLCFCCNLNFLPFSKAIVRLSSDPQYAFTVSYVRNGVILHTGVEFVAAPDEFYRLLDESGTKRNFNAMSELLFYLGVHPLEFWTSFEPPPPTTDRMLSPRSHLAMPQPATLKLASLRSPRSPRSPQQHTASPAASPRSRVADGNDDDDDDDDSADRVAPGPSLSTLRQKPPVVLRRRKAAEPHMDFVDVDLLLRPTASPAVAVATSSEKKSTPSTQPRSIVAQLPRKQFVVGDALILAIGLI
jgi:hypothetical protein